MEKYNTLIQLGFVTYMLENWLECDKQPGLEETAKDLTLQSFRIIGKKLKSCNAIVKSLKYNQATFKTEVVEQIEKASFHLSGKYDLDNSLVLGTIQCIFINCHDRSGKDLKHEIKIAQDLCENCISLIDYKYFDNTDDTVFIEISEYLNNL